MRYRGGKAELEFGCPTEDAASALEASRNARIIVTKMPSGYREKKQFLLDLIARAKRREIDVDTFRVLLQISPDLAAEVHLIGFDF
jgi:hypothetical protein